MWARLEAAKLASPLAKVLQARMWARQDELIDGGMPVTDARELAERETWSRKTFRKIAIRNRSPESPR